MGVPIAELPSQDEREVYVRFGLAAQQAQLFEAQFATILGIGETLRDIENAELQERIDHWRTQTAGRLLATLRSWGGNLHEPVIDTWQRAIHERNRLMHRYFIEHSERGNTASAEGLQRMVDDADDMRMLFTLASDLCVDVRLTTLRNARALVEENENDGPNENDPG